MDKRKIRFTELYYDDAERLALYLSSRDNTEVEIVRRTSEFFPVPPKMKELPGTVDAFSVGDCEIAYLDRRKYPEQDVKYRNRSLHRVMLGDRLREARESRGMTYEGLEMITGIKAKNIENIELGRHDVSIDILGNICDALGCHVDFVFN